MQKNKLIRVIILALVCVFVGSCLMACGGNGGNGGNSSSASESVITSESGSENESVITSESESVITSESDSESESESVITSESDSDSESIVVVEYTVTFDTDGGSEIQSVKVAENETLEEPEDPVKEGYTFDGWTLDGAEYDFAQPVVGDMTLLATWEINKYDVTFDADGGSAVDPQNVEHNAKAVKPDDPTKEGYDFEGWFVGDDEYDFDVAVISAVELKAKWTAKEYTVTYDAGIGSIVEVSKTVTFDSAYGDLPVPTIDEELTGFIGWALDNAGVSMIDATTIVKIADDHTIYAIYDTCAKMYDFSTADQIKALAYPVNATHSIKDDSYVEITRNESGSAYLKIEAYRLKAGAKVEVLASYESADNVFVNGVNQFTFGLAEANQTGNQIDGANAKYVGSAPWDGGWNGSMRKFDLDILHDCYGVRVHLVFNNAENAVFKIYAIRVTPSTEVKEEPRVVNYDFTDKFDMATISDRSNTTISLESTSAKLAPTDNATAEGNANMPQSEFVFSADLKKGMIVEMEFELVGGINVGHGVWTYGINQNGDNLFEGVAITAWDAPNTWNNGKFTAITKMTADCAGVKVLLRYAQNGDAYWLLKSLKTVKVAASYDFTNDDDYASIQDRSNTTVSLEGTNIKLAPTDNATAEGNANMPQSEFVFVNPYLAKNMVVEMDFELVGGINAGHGVWTYGVNKNGDNLFEGTAITAWDAPNTWNNGVFTAKTLITRDCVGVKVLLRYAQNGEAYWLLKGLRVTPLTMNYDFTNANDFASVSDKSNTTVSLEGTSIKLAPTDNSTEAENHNKPQSEFIFANSLLTKGMVVEMDFELVGSIVTGHGVWTYGVNKNGDNLFEGTAITGWDAPKVWNNGVFTAKTLITQDCAGVKVLLRYAENGEAYWLLKAVRVTPLTMNYDFTNANDLALIRDLSNTTVSLDGVNVKLAPTDNSTEAENPNKPQSEIVFDCPLLTKGMSVEMDFELVGDINVGHGVWTYGVNKTVETVCDGVAMTGWDAPDTWNSGVFTATTTITQDCTGIRVLLRYAQNGDAYWLLKAVRIKY